MQRNHWKSDLQPLLRPDSIAVVGISGGQKLGMGGNAVKNLLDFGYPGKIYPVNPKYNEILGLRCYPQISEIPDPVDALLIAIPAQGVVSILEQAAEKGVKAATVFTSGFAESGEKGQDLQKKMIKICEHHQIRLCGPNNMGILSFHERMMLYSAHIPEDVSPGGFAFVGQSGSITMCALATAYSRGLGCSYLVTSGNEAVLEASDYFRFLLDDPNTRVIGCFIESFKDPDKISEAADLAMEKGKPIIILKVGRSRKGAQAAQSHTGSMTGSDVVQDAFFKQKGIIRVHGIEELVETAELFLKSRIPKRNRLAFTMISGGGCGIIADLCDQYGLQIPELSRETVEALKEVVPPFGNVNNPLDLTGFAYRNPDMYYRCIEILLKENVDIICMDPDIPWIEPLFEKANEFSLHTDKLLCILSLTSENLTEKKRNMWRESAVPILQDPDRGLKAIKALTWFSEYVKSRKSVDPDPYISDQNREKAAQLLSNREKSLNEWESKQLLSLYGIPVTCEEPARSPEEAVRIARRIGFPVVLKVLSGDILHKTETEGIALNVENENQLRLEYEKILQNARHLNPGASIEGVLVQQMVKNGIELILGMSQDEQFGPYVIFGLGGIYVEALGDVSLRLASVNKTDALAMIREIRGFRILQGFRGRAPIDINLLADIVVRFSQLAVDVKDRAREMDINPLIATPEVNGIKAADALVVLR